MAYDKNENYCTFSPDRLFGVTFNYGCYLHDRQYRNEVKVRKTRKEADIQLKECIQREFSDNKKIMGFFISWIYYIFVRLFGGVVWLKN